MPLVDLKFGNNTQKPPVVKSLLKTAEAREGVNVSGDVDVVFAMGQ